MSCLPKNELLIPKDEILGLQSQNVLKELDIRVERRREKNRYPQDSNLPVGRLKYRDRF
jgi:hypothetical protein